MYLQANGLTSREGLEKARSAVPGRRSLDWLQLQWQLARPYARYAYYRLFPNHRPGYFRDAWKRPNFRLSVPNSATPVPPASRDFTLFFLPMTDWHARIQRSQHLAKSSDPRDFQTLRTDDGRPHRSTLGYIGALDYWFDIDAVMKAAVDHPDCKFVLVGRVEDRRIHRLRACENVEFVGEVPYADVPRHLAGWDVAMIPFLRSDLTPATKPIKLYEYFSAGLPVVSTALPEVELHNDYVYLANTPLEFGAMVTKALQETAEPLRIKRQEVARRETWSNRAQCLLEMVDGGSQPYRRVNWAAPIEAGLPGLGTQLRVRH
jgi:glycosyltransferase involved in cell wall biosynthesis